MPNVLNKSLELVKTYSGTLASAFSYSGGVVSIRAAESVICNYAYIPTIGRYYFVDSVTVHGDVCMLTLRCDVLTTYKTQIEKCNGVRVYSDSGDVNASNREYVTNGVSTSEIEFTPVNGFSSEGSIIMLTIKGNK